MKPGDRVLCIDGNFSRAWEEDIVYPQKWGQYTIREVTPDGRYIRLVEIVNPKKVYVKEGLCEAAFDRTKFVPITLTLRKNVVRDLEPHPITYLP